MAGKMGTVIILRHIMSKILGVLGGMGPLATVDFLQKHVPVIAYSVPQMPERPPAIVGSGASPLPQMLDGIRSLKRAGATTIAIACNTAHHWYEALAAQGGLPILHIADAACAALGEAAPRRVGLIATDGTIAAGFYQSRLQARGIECLLCDGGDQRMLVLPAIEHVKRNELGEAHELAARTVQHLRGRGAQTIIMGCTEIPLALEFQPTALAAHCIDATRTLARACVAWWQAPE
jgi:aspartate racemase